jgi:hypothetical protein
MRTEDGAFELTSQAMELLGEIVDCRNLSAFDWLEIFNQGADKPMAVEAFRRDLDALVDSDYVLCQLITDSGRQDLKALPTPQPPLESMWFSITDRGKEAMTTWWSNQREGSA